MIQKFIATTLGKVAIAAIAVLAFYMLVQYLAWEKAAQPKQDARSANAVAETAKESAEIAIERSGEDATVDKLVEKTAKLIDNAATPAEADKAARAAICALPEYAKDKSCAN